VLAAQRLSSLAKKNKSMFVDAEGLEDEEGRPPFTPLKAAAIAAKLKEGQQKRSARLIDKETFRVACRLTRRSVAPVLVYFIQQRR
jgi:hypothetical protein